MKRILLIVGVLLMSISMSSQNKNAKAKFEVDGICGMCKVRIQKAALKTKGVKSASWDVKTHMLSLIIDERKTDVKIVQKNIANVGHSTQEIECSLEAYNNLDACCKYNDAQVVKDHEPKAEKNKNY
jgi:mercuric ion binding protein